MRPKDQAGSAPAQFTLLVAFIAGSIGAAVTAAGAFLNDGALLDGDLRGDETSQVQQVDNIAELPTMDADEAVKWWGDATRTISAWVER